MKAKPDSYKAALQLADTVVTHCLPPWFPSVGTILYLAGLGLSVTCRLPGPSGFASKESPSATHEDLQENIGVKF